MRFVFVVPLALVVALGSLGACSSDNTGGTGNGVTPDDDGGVPDEDGATVDPPGTPPPGTDGSAPVSKVDVTNETITSGGSSRQYTLALPKNYDAGKSYPLILFLHGDGGTGPTMRKSFTFDDVTGDEAIVAYPSGNGTTWDLSTAFDQNADQKFLVDLVTALKGKYSIAAGKVFGAGYSSGGFQVNQMACRKGGLFRGLIVFAGGAPFEDPEPAQYPNGALKCNGQEQATAVFVVHGTADGTVEPSSGDYDATYWAYINGCQDTRSSTTPSPCQKHDGCPAANPAVFCLVPGLNHFPWMPGAQAAWDLFKTL